MAIDEQEISQWSARIVAQELKKHCSEPDNLVCYCLYDQSFTTGIRLKFFVTNILYEGCLSIVTSWSYRLIPKEPVSQFVKERKKWEAELKEFLYESSIKPRVIPALAKCLIELQF